MPDMTPMLLYFILRKHRYKPTTPRHHPTPKGTLSPSTPRGDTPHGSRPCPGTPGVRSSPSSLPKPAGPATPRATPAPARPAVPASARGGLQRRAALMALRCSRRPLPSAPGRRHLARPGPGTPSGSALPPAAEGSPAPGAGGERGANIADPRLPKNSPDPCRGTQLACFWRWLLKY